MGIAALVLILAVVATVSGLSGFMGFMVGQRRLDPPPSSPQDRRITTQADRIESLEDEIRRLKDQADFTEKLLSERGGTGGDDAANA